MLDPVRMEGTEGQPRIRVDLLRVLLHVRLLLYSLKLDEQELGRVLDLGLGALLLALFDVLLDQLGEDRMVDGQPVKVVEVLD